jgi:hypothetical protein
MLWPGDRHRGCSPLNVHLDREAAFLDLRVDAADLDRILLARLMRARCRRGRRRCAAGSTRRPGGQLEAARVVDAADVLVGLDGLADLQAEVGQHGRRSARARPAHRRWR